MKTPEGMKRKVLKLTACALAAGLVLTLSGCTNGIGDTVELIKKAETAKQDAEQLINGTGDRIVVGSVADPAYVAKEKSSILDFVITCSGTTFTAAWNVETSSETVQVQIFADADTADADGTKIASFDAADPKASTEFQYKNLDDGTYYCYLRVVTKDGAPLVAYCATPLAVELESPDGALEAIEISVEDGYVVFTWADSSKANEMYHAMLFAPDNTDAVIADATVIDFRARIEIPEGDYEYLYAAVASYNNGTVGPYRLYKIAIPEHATENGGE